MLLTGIGMVEGGTKQTKKCGKLIELVTGSAIQTEEGCSLLQRGVFFFSVTLLLTLLLTAAVFYELISGSMSAQTVAGTIGLHGLPKHLLLLTPFAILFVTLISGLLFFIRHIAVPVDKIGIAIRRMKDGQLNQPVQVTAENEIGRIGELINDLAINKQEVLLYLWNHTQENRELIDRLEKRVHAHPGKRGMVPLMEEIFTQLKQGNNDVKSMILLYDFFDLKLEKGKMLINHSD